LYYTDVLDIRFWMNTISFSPVEILIVEDNPQDAELAIRALKKLNLAIHIVVAEDGEEALNIIFSRVVSEARQALMPPKVIFLDLKLPKVSGLDILKEIKSNPSTKMIPVVIITSSREDPDIKAAYEFGANGYVVKPVEFEAFSNSMIQTGLFWLTVNETPR
jgi:two-component system, response regulator